MKGIWPHRLPVVASLIRHGRASCVLKTHGAWFKFKNAFGRKRPNYELPVCLTI